MDGKLPFMDMLQQCSSDGFISSTIYRKPTHTDMYGTYSSPPKSLRTKAFRHCQALYFHKREQGVGETNVKFDAALRKLVVHCQFGEMLEASLRNQFVCGLRHDAIQRRLLSEKVR